MNSTTVRFIRAAARVTSAVSPALGAGFLHRLFTTPLARRTPDRERAWLADAIGSRLPLSDGRELQLWHWGERGPAVLLVHGWGGAASQLGIFAAPLVELGYRVVAFDQPAHGASDGKRSAMPDFADAVGAVAGAHGPFEGTVAHSLGAAAALLALHRGAPLGRVAAVAPAEDLPAYLEQVSGLLGFPTSVLEPTKRQIEQRWGVPIEAARPSGFAAQLRAPGLVVHDLDDREVAIGEGRAIADAWPGATFLETRGLGHRRILRDSEVIGAVLSFVSSRSTSLAA